jgi:hypothetical protein
MFILRCTRKLLSALDIRPTDCPGPSTNTLGEWYANTIETTAGDLVIFANARTLLSVAIPTSAISQLVPLFVARVYNLLRVIGVPKPLADREISAYRSIQYAKTASRSVLGSLNQIAYSYQDTAELSEADQPLSLQRTELELSSFLHKPLGYVHPAEFAIELLEKGQANE